MLSKNPSYGLADAATIYASYGWFVFPCQRNKRPYTPKGFLDASTDPHQLVEWWQEWPQAAVGIACGASGLVVIDYDPRHDPDGAGAKLLHDLTDGHATRQARTGSGGTHYYYQAPPGDELRNSAGQIGPGIDVRAQGGYVIAPPSENDSGQYTWSNHAPILPLPARLLEASKSRTKLSIVPEAGEGNGGIPEGGRNATLMALAGAMRRRGTSPLAIEQALLVENKDRCVPPLPEDEVRTIARSVNRYAPEEAQIEIPPDGGPVAELLESDMVRISIRLKGGEPAVFTFTEMEKSQRELACHLALNVFGASEPYQQRVNLESNSARTEVRRELNELYGKDRGWAMALNSVWWLARKVFLEQDRSVILADVPLVQDQRDLIHPLMPSSGTTIFFGDGSSSKSYIVMSLVVSGMVGRALAGLYEAPDIRVLYIDYEDEESNQRLRLQRVAEGFGLTEPPRGLHYWRAHVPLKDCWRTVKEVCDRHGIEMVVLDSLGEACAGPPEEAASALAVMGALRQLERPCLAIAHITKGGNGAATEKPFGSTFFHNASRRTWFIERVQEEESDVMRVALRCKKVNDGRKPFPLGFVVTFEGRTGPVRVGPFDINTSPELMENAPAHSRIWAILERAMPVREIGELSGLPVGTVKKTLQRHKERFTKVGAIPINGGRGNQELQLWGRLQASGKTVSADPWD